MKWGEGEGGRGGRKRVEEAISWEEEEQEERKKGCSEDDKERHTWDHPFLTYVTLAWAWKLCGSTHVCWK